MSVEQIISREAIAHQAERAAWAYVAAGARGERPPNPYCPQFEPAHFEAWAASFARSLHNLTAPDAEASA